MLETTQLVARRREGRARDLRFVVYTLHVVRNLRSVESLPGLLQRESHTKNGGLNLTVGCPSTPSGKRLEWSYSRLRCKTVIGWLDHPSRRLTVE